VEGIKKLSAKCSSPGIWIESIIEKRYKHSKAVRPMNTAPGN